VFDTAVPLDDYGVLVGTLRSHVRDQPDNQGRWYHVNLTVEAPAGQYRCAVDVDSKQSAVGVQWKTLTVATSQLGPVAGRTPGYHDLVSNSSSGALDYQRHPLLNNSPGCVFVQQPPAWLQTLIDLLWPRQPWTSGSNLDAAAALEASLVVGADVLIFGEPFQTGLGMHNIHQNQGDPPGTQWWPDNGTWQDGGVITRHADGRADIFISKFSTQSDHTGADGHPA
jgi:Uncharacterized conserved protein (DUF2278)